MESFGYDSSTKIWSGPSNPPIYNPSAGLGYLILNLLKNSPERVIQVNADDGVETTCGQMFEKSVKIARFLSSLGLKQHDVVGIIGKNSENLTPVVLACLTLGLPVNPLVSILNEADIIYMFSKTRPKVIFCDANLVSVIKNATDKMALETKAIVTLIKRVEGYKFVDEIIENADRNVENYVFPELIDISTTSAFIMCSSGTTGMVKGICKSHEELIATTEPLYKQFTNSSEVLFFTSSLSWITAVYAILYSGLFGVKRVITSSDITADSYLDILEKQNVTVTVFYEYLWIMISNCPNLRPIKSVRSVIVGSHAIQEKFIEKARLMFPNAKIVCAYGSTEGGFITYTKGEQKSWSSGQPISGCKIKIVSDDGERLGPNQPGEIFFTKTVNFPGYFNEPEKYVATVKDGWVRSGDLGYFDDHGNIFVTERITDLLDLFVPCTSLELETIVNEIEGVRASAIIGVYDHSKGYDIVHAFVIKKSESDLTSEYIENYVADRVHEGKKLTGGVHFVDEFPLSSSGKVKKVELRNIAKKNSKENNIIKDWKI